MCQPLTLQPHPRQYTLSHQAGLTHICSKYHPMSVCAIQRVPPPGPCAVLEIAIWFWLSWDEKLRLP